MKPGRPSHTALRVATQRAAHQIFDTPRVLDDPVAVPILGPEAGARIRASERRFRMGPAAALRAFIVARSRVAEDALRAAMERGVAQYVVLGAGLDTFAYRPDTPAARLRIFEADYPATQEWKRERLAAAGIAPPASLTYVPIDFESQRLPERLSESGFREDQPAFFSWLGVTMYLRREVIRETLGWVAARPAGSGITFDYFMPPDRLPWYGRIFFHIRAWQVARGGEPWRTWFDPEPLAQELTGLGFTRIEDLDLAALNVRYFEGRAKRLGGSGIARVVTAWR